MHLSVCDISKACSMNSVHSQRENDEHAVVVRLLTSFSFLVIIFYGTKCVFKKIILTTVILPLHLEVMCDACDIIIYLNRVFIDKDMLHNNDDNEGRRKGNKRSRKFTTPATKYLKYLKYLKHLRCDLHSLTHTKENTLNVIYRRTFVH
jgi:hypothetical protein